MKKNNQKPSPEKYIRERARTLPIGDCYINNHWEEMGMAIVLITRLHKQGTITTGMYSIDINCRGLIDTEYFFNMKNEDLVTMKEIFNKDGFIMEKTTYTYAHNIVYGAVYFAEEAGIKPHPGFNITQYILEEDTEDIPLMQFEFGNDGRHYLYADDEKMLNKYLPTMKRHLGNNFGYILRDDYYRQHPEFIDNYIADNLDKKD